MCSHLSWQNTGVQWNLFNQQSQITPKWFTCQMLQTTSTLTFVPTKQKDPDLCSNRPATIFSGQSSSITRQPSMGEGQQAGEFISPTHTDINYCSQTFSASTLLILWQVNWSRPLDPIEQEMEAVSNHYWTGLLNWTTGLTFETQFSHEIISFYVWFCTLVQF